jgi:hypothetical protein
MSAEQLVALAGVIAALTALVVQTTRLIKIAERYMVELRRANRVNEAWMYSWPRPASGENWVPPVGESPTHGPSPKDVDSGVGGSDA